MGDIKINSEKFLSIIPFHGLFNWSVQYITNTKIGFTTAFPMVRIGDFLSRNRTPIIKDDKKEYVRVRIKTHNGGVERREKKNVLGKDIKTKKQYVISEGQFIVSKIDARNGAMGIVPKELDGAIVTQDFLPYDIDTTQINPEYFVLVCTTKPFIEYCQSCSSGTTNRQRINEEEFLNIRIPVPSLSYQRKIICRYKDKIKEANSLNHNANQIEIDINDYTFNILGYETKQNKKERKSIYKYIKFVNFLDISEWGVDIVLNKQKKEIFKYPIIKIKDLCKLGSGGTPSRSCPQYYKGAIPWVKTGEVLNNVIFETEEHISEDAIVNSSAKLYPKGSLIIAMYGQGDTRGRTAKLGIDATTNQACAVLHDIDNSVVSTDYLWYFLQGRYDDLRSMASGNNQPNLNAGKINNYDVVVPPMDVQKEMVAYIKEQKALSKLLKQKATSMRKEALIEFENELFE